jgi:hypothetical protein
MLLLWRVVLSPLSSTSISAHQLIEMKLSLRVGLLASVVALSALSNLYLYVNKAPGPSKHSLSLATSLAGFSVWLPLLVEGLHIVCFQPQREPVKEGRRGEGEGDGDGDEVTLEVMNNPLGERRTASWRATSSKRIDSGTRGGPTMLIKKASGHVGAEETIRSRNEGHARGEGQREHARQVCVRSW